MDSAVTLEQIANRLDERAAALAGPLELAQARLLLEEGSRMGELLLAHRESVTREWLALADQAALARSLTPPESAAVRLMLRG